ncbi:hypothetical protein DMB38_09370 [Streptomyces sp. WAC 06738]|uniref:hypothetical protein n=1 Tax=Streptomyces sp. WAC 06738 TaxID=2203210 RepID=UPI000F702AF0|nr:hypothetical protein [Streptomyces sp. WAC 06738]AZM46001.1 hypothetical protein DMB38_09370 [Streptomyces sp. WAC 06738]
MDNTYRIHVVHADAPAGPVRLRVLLVHHEPWWDQTMLLPSDPGFFLQVLREAADGDAGRPRGPLAGEVGEAQLLDAAFVRANAHRFVADVERVAVRHHPVDDALAEFYRNAYDTLDHLYYAGTFNGRYRPGEHGALEERLVQAEYDVRPTDSRWTQTLRAGQCWGTRAWGPITQAEASVRLGWMLWDDDPEGAAAAFRHAIELEHGDPYAKVEARLHLDALLTGQDQYAVQDQGPEAPLELALRLHSEGHEAEARAAYAQAVSRGDCSVGGVFLGGASVIAEARRRAGMESPAEYGHRLAQAGDLSRAAAELRRIYDDGSARVAAFALALCEGAFDRADEISGGSLEGDLAGTWMGQFAMDLAFVHARAGHTDTARRLADLADEGLNSGPFLHALASGSARPAELAVEMGTALVDKIVNPAWDDGIEAIVDVARVHLPELAVYACRAQAACESAYGQEENAARWRTRLARLEAAGPLH